MGILPFIRPKKDRPQAPTAPGGMTINITPDPERIAALVKQQLDDDPTARQRLADWLRKHMEP